MIFEQFQACRPFSAQGASHFDRFRDSNKKHPWNGIYLHISITNACFPMKLRETNVWMKMGGPDKKLLESIRKLLMLYGDRVS